MFRLDRGLFVLFAAGSVAACLMGAGLLLVADDLMSAGQPFSVSAITPQR
jgi:hypothetical protein